MQVTSFEMGRRGGGGALNMFKGKRSPITLCIDHWKISYMYNHRYKFKMLPLIVCVNAHVIKVLSI